MASITKNIGGVDYTFSSDEYSNQGQFYLALNQVITLVNRQTNISNTKQYLEVLDKKLDTLDIKRT